MTLARKEPCCASRRRLSLVPCEGGVNFRRGLHDELVLAAELPPKTASFFNAPVAEPWLLVASSFTRYFRGVVFDVDGAVLERIMAVRVARPHNPPGE